MSGTRSRCCAIRRCENLEPCRSWLALVAVLLTNMLLNLADSFGVYYDALVDKYDASRAAVGWIFSIRWTFIFLAGGFISPFIDIYGCRPVAMTFALLYAVATTLSAFAPTIGSLYFIYSALTGLGDSGMYLAGVTTIQRLFNRNRGLATGVAGLGFPIGVIIHPLHAQLFLDLYGVSGVFLMHGAISFHALIFAFALKTPPRLRQVSQDDAGKHNYDNKDDHIGDCHDDDDDDDGNGDDGGGKKLQPDNCNLKQASPKKAKCHKLSNYFRQLVDFSILRNAVFALTVIHYTLLWQVRLGVVTQIVNCAKFRGIPVNEASHLLSLSGLISLCMTVVSAVVMNSSCLNPALYSGLAALCLASSAFGCAFSHSYATFCGSAAVLGFADGIAAANLPLVVLHAVGLKKFPKGMGLLWMLLTPSAMGSAPFVGWMVDRFQSYMAAFVILGMLGLASALLTVVIVIVRSRTNRMNSKVTIADKQDSPN